MIKHLGEGLVPFEDCGFARYPEIPCVGVEVIVRCRVDYSDALPVLTMRSEEGVFSVQPIPEKPHHYRFPLGIFNAAQQVSYQIATNEEKTRWHTFDVVTKESFSTFEKCQSIDDNTALAALSKDVFLTVKAGEKLEMALAQGSCDPSGNGECELTLPGGFRFTCGLGKLWAIERSGVTVCEATEYEFRRNKQGKILKAALKMRLCSEHILGTGERFDAVDQSGLGSNGRVVEKFTRQGAQTYLPVPFFMTEQGFGWFRESDIPVHMTFEDQTVIAQETEGKCLTKDILLFGEPADVLEQYLSLTGDKVLPPEWAFGTWISGNGWNSQSEIDAQLAFLKKHNYPASVMVLEQWSDERTFYKWHQERFAHPEKTVRRIRDAGLHLVLWQIPVIKHEWDGVPGEDLENDTKEAIQNRYAIQNEDGTPYRITENWFHHSLLPDFTNPEALAWWFDKRKYLLDMGVEGFKTDGGEFLFDKTARLHDGTSGLSGHNLYPIEYARAYHDFMRAHGVQGVTFSRAGCVGAQSVPIHWAGDQASEWSEFQSQLRAGISAGLSGILFWSFDIGGFAGPLPDAELYLRATAMGCFCPVMQWHSEPRKGQFSGGEGEAYNNDRSPWNMAEKLNDSKVLDIACRFAQLRESLRPYLWREAQHCVSAGRPLMAHLCLDYPFDTKAWTVHDQYMLGRDLLVAPVTQEGASGRLVYLPQGEWMDFFTGEKWTGGQEITVDCALNSIPVFKRGIDADI